MSSWIASTASQSRAACNREGCMLFEHGCKLNSINSCTAVVFSKIEMFRGGKSNHEYVLFHEILVRLSFVCSPSCPPTIVFKKYTRREDRFVRVVGVMCPCGEGEGGGDGEDERVRMRIKDISKMRMRWGFLYIVNGGK